MLTAIRIANALAKPFGINPFPRAFENVATAGASDRSSAFDAIYQRDGWNSGESRSGDGSERRKTWNCGLQLLATLNALDVETLFDAPCGDLNWITQWIGRRSYIGGDISGSLISDLQSRYSGLDLRLFDICTDPFPKAICGTAGIACSTCPSPTFERRLRASLSLTFRGRC